ncbi:rhodanese-related sulfurtransferase [Devosia sp. YIM 151766]|uniref:oxygen-dependent tRNA uridine(34) hydroxylase TrhO n=1 Tax=Devosia sp. YIM 151766 TaxID=3017325 RepID=UPI00255CB5E1|nr:rhodanese-related sulfurtransferase [Devosia sp. YIM 151766]WIY52984.1 rhodanese-related sulfurtransferase [Devosia sp. YIM 151766]
MTAHSSYSMPSLPQENHPYKVMALYKFAALPDAERLKAPLAAFCCARGIKGTLILAPEGINGTLAGTPEAIGQLADYLFASGPFGTRLTGAEVKYSSAETAPFLRMKVRLKPEIVTLRAPEADPNRQVGTYVEPEDWNALIARNDVVLVDTRNDYEVGLGTFQRALDPQTQSFVEFKDYVAQNLDPQRDRKVAMFCTGGIRCEKASSYLLSQGFEEVFHLKGGILKYLETVPPEDSRFAGECFVFDERVSVGHGLEPGKASLCRACRHPLTEAERRHPDFHEGVSCPHCIGDKAKHQAAAERQRQMDLAGQRGGAHLGDAAAEDAARRRALKKARAEQSRLANKN